MDFNSFKNDKKEKNENLNQFEVKNKSQKKILVLTQNEKGKEQQKKIRFDKERIVIGSVLSADVRITGEGISPIHAVLEVQLSSKNEDHEKKVGVIFDLASDTGVFVNGKKILVQPIEFKDQITLGQYCFELNFEGLDLEVEKEEIQKVGNRTLFLNSNEDRSVLNLQDEREIIEIFDYRSTSRLALEVVMSWCGVVLAFEHFVREKKVTVGVTRKSDFMIPTPTFSRQYPIVTQRKGHFFLHLDSDMKGVMQIDGQLLSLDELRSKVLKVNNQFEIPIKKSDFAKISISDIDFYFCFTAAPPRLKMKNFLERDPLFLRIFSLSMMLTALSFFSLSKIKLPQTVEIEQVPERIATILYQPEKFLKPPVIPMIHNVKPLAVNQAQVNEKGEGVRVKTGNSLSHKASAKNQKGEGNLDLLKGAQSRIEDILGRSVHKLSESGKDVSNLGVKNRGAGVNAHSFGGFWKTGSGIGLIDTGKEATQGDREDSLSLLDLRSDQPEESIVMGAIDRNAVEAAIYAHRDEFRLCYEREINAERPNLSGQISTSFVIGSSGRVSRAGIDSSSLKQVNVEHCVLSVLKSIIFPVPRGGGWVEVRFPFKFSSVRR